MKSALITVLAVAVAVVVFVATSGHVIFLPLIFVPLVLFWPIGRSGGPRSQVKSEP